MKLTFSCVVLSLGVLAVIASPVEKVEKRLIKRSESDAGIWLTESEILTLKENHESFIDITDHPSYPTKSLNTQSTNGMLHTLISTLTCICTEINWFDMHGDVFNNV